MGSTTTPIDHNSVNLDGARAGFAGAMVGIRIHDATNLCYRNNIVSGGFNTTGLDLDNITFGATGACGTTLSVGQNLVHGTTFRCVGLPCNARCSSTTGGAMCNLTGDPGFADDPWLCLAAEADVLIDTGIQTSWDMWDDPGDTNLFSGPGPEVGAREHGVARTFGGERSDCGYAVPTE
jgi:hypothetical protein